MRTIETENYWLVIGLSHAESKIPDDAYFYNERDNRIEQYEKTKVIFKDDVCFNIICHLPKNSPILEGVPLMLEREDTNVVRKAIDYSYEVYPKEQNDAFFDQKRHLLQVGFEAGHKAAQQKGCYSHEQLVKAIEMAREIYEEWMPGGLPNIKRPKYKPNQIIQSLQPKWEYVVEMEEYGDELGVDPAYFDLPSHRSKTQIINGHTTVIGEWKEVKGV